MDIVQTFFFDQAIKFMARSSPQPFFIFISTNIPHYPLDVPEKYAAFYRLMGLNERTARTYGMLTNFDEIVGRLLKSLKDLNLEDNTIVIFMSDNGPQHGDRFNAGLRGIKGSVYDGGIKVPFFIRWPGRIQEGKEIHHIAAHIDVLPTILDLCGIEIPDYLDGLSLKPLIFEQSPHWPDRYLFFQQTRPDSKGIDEPRLFTHCAVRSQRFKIVMAAKNRQQLYTKAIDQ